MAIDSQIEEELALLTRKKAVLSAREDFSAWCLLCGYTPAKHHQILIEKLQSVVDGKAKKRKIMFLLPPGAAKALTLDTPIPTPNGWSTMGELKVGDWVFDEEGFPCQVLSKSEIFRNRKIYNVSTDCGDTIKADESHEWVVSLGGGGGNGGRSSFRKMTTKELASRKFSKRPLIKRAKELQLSTITLPVEPYVLGCWLGDGHTDGARITIGHEDYFFFEEEFKKLGYPLAQDVRNGISYSPFGLRAQLVSTGLLGNKRIPSEYFRASWYQRISLLQGLIDTDGSVNDRGDICFTNTNKLLCDGVAELVRSLGAKASVSETRATLYGKDCGPCWRVHFYLEGAARLPRKGVKTKNCTRTPDTYIDVTEAGYADTVCICVSSKSHLFLCGKSMTPTHNSTYTSVLFIPWYLGKMPQNCIIACSHSLELAEDFGRKSRNLVSAHSNVLGYTLMQDSKAASKWESSTGGEYRCFGVGAGIAGRRADLGLIDDPIGSQEDADSKTIREKQWNWYLTDFLPRLKPNSIQVLICNRRHEQDLAGMLIEREPSEWDIVSIPFYAISGTDPLGRLPGETLWPDYFNEAFIHDVEKLRTKNPRLFAGLYQQHPTPEDGDFFKSDCLLSYEPQDLPRDLKIYAGSDHAVSKKDDANKSCFVFAGVDPLGDVYVLPDIFWQRADSEEQVNAMLYYNRKLRPIYWRAEKGHISLSIGPFLRRRMREERNYINMHEVVAKRDKPTRARSFQGMVGNRRVYFPKFAPWWAEAEHQLLSFPNSREDDLVDALAHLGNEIENMTSPEAEVETPEFLTPDINMTFGWMKEQRRRESRLSEVEN